MISPQVHRSISRWAIFNYLKNVKNIPVWDIIKERRISTAGGFEFHRVLDELVNEEIITSRELELFLLHELNYGRQNHVYVALLNQDSLQMLMSEETVLGFIRTFESMYEYKNCEEIRSVPYVKDLTVGVDRGEKRLLSFDIIKDGHDIESIRILFVSGFTDSGGATSHDYASVDINLYNKTVVVRLRDFENDNREHTKIASRYTQVMSEILTGFRIGAHISSAQAQNIVYKMVSELTNAVLAPTVDTVNGLLEGDIRTHIDEWTNNLFGEEFMLTDEDRDVMVKAVLHGFYKVFVRVSQGKMSVRDMRKLGVDGYARYIRFVDDTVSEGRARSSSPQESLLDTSIFYDIKARLDQAKHMRLATVYWINIPGHTPRFGTTFYTDTINRLKFVSLADLTREACDYVLHQITKYNQS